jgi:predicted  nucleic acid-binding Zn-ribbon protein
MVEMNSLQSVGATQSAFSSYAANVPSTAELNKIGEQGERSGRDGVEMSDEAQGPDFMRQQLEAQLRDVDKRTRDLQTRMNALQQNTEEGADNGRSKQLQRQMDGLQKERDQLQSQLTGLLGDDAGGGGGGGGESGSALGGVGHIISGLFS